MSSASFQQTRPAFHGRVIQIVSRLKLTNYMKEHIMSEQTTGSSTSTADAAARISALLDDLELLIVDFPAPDPARAGSVHGNARFAGELVTPTITAVMNFEPLRARKLFDADAGRKALAFRDDF